MNKIINLTLIMIASILILFSVISYSFITLEFEKLASDDPTVWRQDIEAFQRMDFRSPPPEDAILFVGSSSIRFWKTLEEDMYPLPVIRRGFGGAKLSDIIHYADKIIFAYRPKAIVLFAGTNDITGRENDKSARQVAGDFIRLAEMISAELPEADLFYLPITPTTSRWEIWPEANRANHLIREYAEDNGKVHFIEATSHFMDEEGKPRKEFLFWDGIHLNNNGYAIWTELVKNSLVPGISNNSITNK
jgi:lysophospholipase L1-like esterase